MSTTKLRGYIEFITYCSEDLQVDKNTNSTMSVLSPHPGGFPYVFRLTPNNDAFTLHRTHRMLPRPHLGSAKGPVRVPYQAENGQQLGLCKLALAGTASGERKHNPGNLQGDGGKGQESETQPSQLLPRRKMRNSKD